MSDAKLLKIIRLCLSIERAASKIYLDLSTHAKGEELQSFWRDLSREENEHVNYWKELLALAELRDLPNVFDDPDKTQKELQAIKVKANDIKKGREEISDINTLFILAYSLEFYLLHPAFETLFHLMKKETANSSPEDNYADHIKHFLEGLNKFGIKTPEFELIAGLIAQLWNSNRQLALQLADIKALRTLVPICSSCKKIRDDNGYWNQVESYMERHLKTEFTHSICPECAKKLYPKYYKGNG